MGIEVAGPKFQIEADYAFILPGVSERREVCEYAASTLDQLRIFRDIQIVPFSERERYIKASLLNALKISLAVTHSAGIIALRQALQVVAINPPEHVTMPQLVKRAMFDVPNEQIVAEEGAHERNFADRAKALLEMVRSLRITARETLAIANGYSAVEHLAAGAENFPAGRAIVHSEFDMYGFADLADMKRAADADITTVMLPEFYHNDFLFRPQAMTELLTPVIFPEVATKSLQTTI